MIRSHSPVNDTAPPIWVVKSVNDLHFRTNEPTTWPSSPGLGEHTATLMMMAFMGAWIDGSNSRERGSSTIQ